MVEKVWNKNAPQLSEAFLEEVWVLLLSAGPKGLEPSTSGLTGRRSNQLNYDPFELYIIDFFYKLKKEELL